MLAREYCDISEPKRKFKPIILSHHMLLGLTGVKMSKSNPDAAIFMDDTEQEVKTKIKKAFCEPGNIEVNPCIEYIQYIVLPSTGSFTVSRDEKNGGDISYTDIEELKKDFKDQKIHPSELKPSLSTAINKLLEPIRDHFKNNSEANKLMNQVKKFKVTK
jgi:tyrosyl-tRNA synthetase